MIQTISFFDRKDVPEEKKRAIRAMTATSDRAGLKNALTVLAMYGVAIALFSLAHSAFATVPATIVMACAMMRGGFLMHEASHYNLFQNRRWNRVFALLFGVPIGLPISAYRYIHNQHHANERTDSDPDDLRVIARKLHVHLTIVRWVMLVCATPGYIFQTAGMSLKMIVMERRWDFLFEYGLIALFFTAVAQLLSFPEFQRVYLVPVVIALLVMNIRALAEHELTADGSAFMRTRTVISNRFIRWMMYNANYHLEHHLYPGVPSFRLPELHSLLSAEEHIAHSSIVPGYGQFLRSFFRTTATELAADCTRRIHRSHIGHLFHYRYGN